jgi:hypothetical protein
MRLDGHQPRVWGVVSYHRWPRIEDLIEAQEEERQMHDARPNQNERAIPFLTIAGRLN